MCFERSGSMTQKKSREGLRKDGTSKSLRSGRARSGGTPRIMLVGALIVIAAAAFLFWPKGGPSPTGIGEKRSVVTAPALPDSGAATMSDNRPRSSEVDIEKTAVTITPEKPEGETETSPARTPPAAEQKAAAARAPTRPRADTPRQPAVQPRPEGRWAVQTGGFGQAENADQEAARLQDLGWNSVVMAGSNNQGQMVYRVWIGYFANRDEAQLFLQQNSDKLADAYVVHR